MSKLPQAPKAPMPLPDAPVKPSGHDKLPDEKKGDLVTMAKLAVMMGVTPRTIKNWIMDGMPCEEKGSGRTWLLDSAKCFKWRIEKAEADIAKKYDYLTDPEELSLTEIKKRTAEATMNREELKYEKEAGEVMFIEEMMDNFSAVLAEIRGKLISLPSRRSGVLAHEEQEEIERILNEEVTELLEAMSSYEHSYIEAGET